VLKHYPHYRTYSYSSYPYLISYSHSHYSYCSPPTQIFDFSFLLLFQLFSISSWNPQSYCFLNVFGSFFFSGPGYGNRSSWIFAVFCPSFFGRFGSRFGTSIGRPGLGPGFFRPGSCRGHGACLCWILQPTFYLQLIYHSSFFCSHRHLGGLRIQ